MANKEFKQSVSTKVILHHRELANGTKGLFLRVIVDRKKREFTSNSLNAFYAKNPPFDITLKFLTYFAMPYLKDGEHY